MIKLAHIEYLYALSLLPLLIGLFWWAARSRTRSIQMIGNPRLIARLIHGWSSRRRFLKSILLASAFTFLILGLANPQIGTKFEEVKREGVDIFIALDVSNSMKAEDIKPNRLEYAKRQIALMLDRLQNDRIGLIVFAGDSYLQLPLTTDYGAARLFLSTIDVDIVPIPGTAIGSAIRMAMKSFVEGEKKHKVIVVISDGENHEDDALAAAKEAASDGAIVHAIGMGSPVGTPIPVYQNNQLVGFKKDQDGSIVMTKLDEEALQQIANAGGGTYVRATGQSSALEAVFREIEAMEKKEFGARVFTEYEDRFQYFLAIAFLLLAIEFFTGERRQDWLRKWKTKFSPLASQNSGDSQR